MLAGATLIPGYASGSASPPCPARGCAHQGTLRWTRRLTGSWIAEGGIAGTVPAAGQAYVSAGPQVAAVGYGMNVYAFDEATGQPLWASPLAGFPAGASIVAVRSWQRVVTAGVDFTDPRTDSTVRNEVVLSGQTGQRLRGYAATAYGGAVAADLAHTVIVGNTSVTSYDNASGKPLWRRSTGTVPQAWRVNGGTLLVTIAAGGYLGTAPVTALRRINLATGAERLIRPPHGSFDGTLSAALDGVALFSGSAGLSAYSQATGGLLWHRRGAVLQGEDLVRNVLYVSKGSGLTGLEPAHRRRCQGNAGPGGVKLLRGQGRRGAGTRHGVRRRRLGLRRRAAPCRLDHAVAAVAALLRRPVRYRRQRGPVEQHGPAGRVRRARSPGERGHDSRKRAGVPATGTGGDQPLTRGMLTGRGSPGW